MRDAQADRDEQDESEHDPELTEVNERQLTLQRFEPAGAAGPEGYEPVVLVSDQRNIQTHYYAPARRFCKPAGPVPAAIFVGGVGGGFDTPVPGWLYPRMCRTLADDGVAALGVRFRRPGHLEHCVLDVLAALAFLDEEDVGPVALVGHSFGGAVVIRAALLSPAVVTCVPLSTQSYGVGEAVEHLGPRCSILFGHGTDDEILPAHISQSLYKIASDPKKLLLKKGARHGLDEWADELPQLLREWIESELRRACGAWRSPQLR